MSKLTWAIVIVTALLGLWALHVHFEELEWRQHYMDEEKVVRGFRFDELKEVR